ncbi:radical SAM protein [Candidatus Woesearchaeota archaeon]|nr:radical SAM protein [Candidatus Woesearchaeota archaeon]
MAWQENHKANYFGRAPAKLEKAKEVRITNPLGESRVLENILLVQDPEFIREMASGYLAIELTPSCNLGCSTCINSSNLSQATPMNAPFMDMEFATKLAELVGITPFVAKRRIIAITGGEVTLNLDRAAYISHLFADASNLNEVIMVTNGVALPLGQLELEAALSKIDPRVRLQLSYNAPLLQQYRLFQGKNIPDYYVPNSKDPLLAKIIAISKAARTLKIPVVVRVTEFPGEQLYEQLNCIAELAELNLESAPMLRLGSASKHPQAMPASPVAPPKLDSLYIQAGGNLYPTVFYIGVSPIGILASVTDVKYN